MTASLQISLQNPLKDEASPCISQEIEPFKCLTDHVATEQRNNTAMEISKEKKVKE